MTNFKKVLVTGGSGLLGVGLQQTIPENIQSDFTFFRNNLNLNIDKISYKQLNITDEKNVYNLFSENNYDFIIHAASIGSVDYCQKNKSEAEKVNIEGTANLIKHMNKNCHFIFISSNAVFDGKSAPYHEKSQVNPINYYGYTKVRGEEIVSKSTKKYTIIRPVLMFGWNLPNERKNPATWIIDELKKKHELNLVNDVFNNPLLNTQAAEVIWHTIDKGIGGIIHIAGKTRVSRYEFGLNVADIFDLDRGLISEVDSSYFPQITQRMPDTTYSTRLMHEFGISPLKLSDALRIMKNRKPKWAS